MTRGSVVQADAGSEHERILFGLPVVLDTDDDSIAVGDTLLLQYQVSRRRRSQPQHDAIRAEAAVQLHLSMSGFGLTLRMHAQHQVLGMPQSGQ